MGILRHIPQIAPTLANVQRPRSLRRRLSAQQIRVHPLDVRCGETRRRWFSDRLLTVNVHCIGIRIGIGVLVTLSLKIQSLSVDRQWVR